MTDASQNAQLRLAHFPPLPVTCLDHLDGVRLSRALVLHANNAAKTPATYQSFNVILCCDPGVKLGSIFCHLLPLRVGQFWRVLRGLSGSSGSGGLGLGLGLTLGGGVSFVTSPSTSPTRLASSAIPSYEVLIDICLRRWERINLKNTVTNKSRTKVEYFSVDKRRNCCKQYKLMYGWMHEQDGFLSFQCTNEGINQSCWIGWTSRQKSSRVMTWCPLADLLCFELFMLVITLMIWQRTKKWRRQGDNSVMWFWMSKPWLLSAGTHWLYGRFTDAELKLLYPPVPSINPPDYVD